MKLTVPTIATQYLRNRKEHDATARQWTDNFARPKPPPPAPKTDKAKGKKKAVAESSGAGGSSSSARSNAAGASTSSTMEVIELDSDGEEPSSASKGKKRKRGAPSGSNDGEILDLIVSEEEGEATKVQKTRSRKPPSRTGRASGATAPRRSARQAGEVIVIDDE